MLKHDRANALGKWLFIAAGAYFLLHIYNIGYMLFERENSAMVVYQFAGGMGMHAELLPLLAALPAATAFCADWNSGFHVPVALRSGKARYIRSKALSAAVSGGLVALIGKLVFVLVLHVLYQYDPASAQELFEGEVMLDIAFSGFAGYVGYFAGMLAVQFFAGMFWAMSALLFSAFVPNALLTVCVPLVLYRLSMEAYYWLLLPEWANLAVLQAAALDVSLLHMLSLALGVFGALTALAAAGFGVRAKRRLEYA